MPAIAKQHSDQQGFEEILKGPCVRLQLRRHTTASMIFISLEL